jgi:hypothetical protein
LGFEFTVNSVLSVTHLGVYDHDADGLLARAEVGIWDSLGTLLASVFVPSGTSGLLVGTFRYEEISPLELTPGNTYIVGSYIDDLASSFNTGQGGSGFYDSAINPIQDRFSNFNSMFSFPDSSNFHPAGAWTGGNFLYEGRAVPEPASLASAISALVIGFAGCLVRRRRSRQARAS